MNNMLLKARLSAGLCAAGRKVHYRLAGTGARLNEIGYYAVTAHDGRHHWTAGDGETPYQALARAGRLTNQDPPRPSWAFISIPC